MATKNNSAIVAYIPVLHEGYRRLFEKHPEAKQLFILSKDIANSIRQLERDVRALDPELIKKSIEAWKIFETIRIVGLVDLKELVTSKLDLIVPDEDIMREFAANELAGAKIEYDSIFLRWDKFKSTNGQPVEADQTVSADDFDIKMMAALKKEAEKSGDWWRHIASAVVKDGKVILSAYNKHVPYEQMPYVNGDPRSDFKKGVNLELSTSFHSEAGLIAEAARKGISLEGASLYVTTFPCPPCAKLVAYSGIKKLYYADGYGVLDGESILKSKGVEIVFVKTANELDMSIKNE